MNENNNDQLTGTNQPINQGITPQANSQALASSSNPEASTINQVPPQQISPASSDSLNSLESRVDSSISPVQVSTVVTPSNDLTDSSTQKVRDDNYSSPMEERKVSKPRGIAPVIVFFVLAFAFIVALPYITDYFNQRKAEEQNALLEQELEEEEKLREEEEKQKEELENQISTTITCTSIPELVGSKTTMTIYGFSHIDDQLQDVSVTKKMFYQNADAIYEQDKNLCQEKLTNASSVTGYLFECNISELMVEEVDSYELEDYRPDLGVIDSSINYVYGESVNAIVENLKTQGYTCQ